MNKSQSPGTSGYNCPKDLASTDAMRAVFLDTHNDLRRNIALGKQENKVGFLGPAKNMYELVSSSAETLPDFHFLQKIYTP
ncbi:hypothetical protein Aduo_014180 [Ancylostoma duodenale]